MNRFLATLTISACIVSAAQAQFQYAIGTDVYEAGRSVQFAASDPGYIVAGRTDLAVFGAPEATLVKTQLNGTLVWQAVYGQARADIFNSVRDIPNSNNLRAGYAALGTSQSFGLGGDDVYFVRTDLNGIPVFSYIYGRGNDDRGHCLQYIKDPTTSTGTGYVIAGESNSFPQFPGVNIYIIKTDEFGALTRSTVIGGSGDETAYWIEQTRDLGFIVVGTTTTATCSSSTANQDIFAVKLDQNLNIIWNAIIGGGASRPFADVAYGVVENPIDGSYTVTGITQSFGVNFNGDAFLANLNPSTGAVNWFQTYGSDRIEQANTIHVALNTLGQPEYIIGGKSTSYTAGTEDAYLFKTDAAGNLLWTNIYGARGREVFAEVADNAERGYIITGEVENDWSLKNDIYLVKTDANGRTGTGCEISVQQRQLRFEVCQNRSAQQVFVQDNRNITTPYKIVQYRQNRCTPTALDSSVPEEETDARLEFIEPNKLNVTFPKEVQNTTIKVFNTNGELVTQTTAHGLSTELTLPAPGLHIIHITHDNGITTRKKIMN